MTYRQFSYRFTRLLNKAFDQSMYKRFMLHVGLFGVGRKSIRSFSSTMDAFGSAEQCDAFNSLLELMDENPDYVKTMHEKVG